MARNRRWYMNLDKIKCNAFNKAVVDATTACSRGNCNTLLALSAQPHLDAIKARLEEFISQFELKNLNYKDIELYEQILAEAVYREIVLAVHSDNLPKYSENLVSYEQTLQCYDKLVQQIKENFASVKAAYCKRNFNEWREANIIVAATQYDHEKSTLDLAGDSRRIVRVCRTGYANIEIRTENPNPIVWIFYQLRDAKTLIDEYTFFATMAQAVESYHSKYAYTSDEEIQQFLVFMVLKAHDMIRENKDHLQSEIDGFNRIVANLDNPNQLR